MEKFSLIPKKLICFLFLCVGSFHVASAQEPGEKQLKVEAETRGVVLDSLHVEDLNIAVVDSVEVDSLQTDSIPKKKGVLENQVIDNAKGYRKYNRKENKIYLYDEAYVKYGDMELRAGQIVIDLNNNTAYAKGIVDSTGAYTQTPNFKQGSEEVVPDSLLFNFKSKRGLVYKSRTEQGEMKVRSQIVKRQNDSLYYIWNTKFTTSSHPDDDPEYYIQTRKGVFVPGKKIIAGGSQLFFYGVPTPVYIPFAYFPLTTERRSGLIFPTFGENNSRGYFIQNGGYYFAINDYVDLAVLGDYYTNGSYGLRAESNYALRYKFNGNFSLRYENLINGQRGFSDYSRTSIYKINWSHSQDSKASANSRFSASVSLGSSNYYTESINQINTANYLDNTMNSSVSYSKTFPEYPSVNLSLTASHSQNTRTEKISMSLPTFQGSMERIYPFAPKNGSKKGALQNINFQYSFRGENSIETTDSLFFKREMFKNAELGFKHTIPLTTNFKIFKYFSASVGANYNEVWQFQTVQYSDYDEELGEAVLDTVKGFDRFGTYNLSASLGTTVYGQFDFGKDKKIQAIRHVMRPSVSYGYTPSFDQYYEYYIADEDGELAEYTRFKNGMYGTPGKNLSNNFSFALNNTLEAKVRDKDSTATEPKKIKLLNNFNLSSGYNIAADSLAWNSLRITGSTQLFDSKMTVNFGATLDPYALDATNTRIEKFNIDNGGSLFRLTNANVTANYSFSSKDFDKDQKENDNKSANEDTTEGLFGENQDFTDKDYEEDEDDGKDIVNDNFSNGIPWDVRLAYSLTYSNATRQSTISTNSLMFTGNVELSPRWKVGVSSGYDFNEKGFTYTQLRFERDLESWRMNFNWVPFSSRSSWYFFIGIKSSLLSDLKWEKRRTPDKSL